MTLIQLKKIYFILLFSDFLFYSNKQINVADSSLNEKIDHRCANLNYYLFDLNTKMLQYFAQSKHTQDIKYSPEDFLFRWKKLERVIEKEGIDALLLVTGLDGGEHSYTNYLFNWLFLGLSGAAIFNNKYLDPNYSEIIIVISSRQSYLFITPTAKRQFQPLIYTLQNLNVFCPTESEYMAKDNLDIQKVGYFYQAVNKLTKIGVFLGPEQDAKIIQKWPIIQSYALEPVGRTFFTLKYQTVNLNQRITPLYRNLDKHSLQDLVATTVFSLQGQIRGSTQIIEYTKKQERKNITQLKLQQPLFEAADIAKSENVLQIPPIKVLFGQRTAGGHSSASSIQSTKAFHFTVEHADPITKIQIWRSYFLKLCTQQNTAVSLFQQQSQQSFLVTSKYVINYSKDSSFADKNWLVICYLGLVQGVIDSIATVSKDYRNLNKQYLQGHISNRVNQSLNSTSETFKKQDFEIFLQSFDALGEPKPIDFKDSITFKLSTTFYVLKVRLNNVKSINNESSLGSLCFSQSFLLQEGCYLLLTKTTPYFDFWKTDNFDQSFLESLNPNVPFPQLGSCLSSDFRYRLFVPLQKLSTFHFNIPIIQAKYYFHQKGLRIYNQKTGWHILLYSAILEATMINKIAGQWVLFKTKQALFFEGIESNVIAIEFRGKAFDFLLKKVNDKFQPLPLSFLDVIPPLLAENWYFTEQVLKKEVRDGALIHQHQILQNDFLWSFIQAKQLMVLNQMKDLKMTVFRSLYQQKIDKKIEAAVPSEKPSLAIISGTYATNKYKLAQTLARFGNKDSSYHIFHISYENLFSRMQKNTFIQMLDQFISDAPESPKRLFIVVVPSWLNAAQTIPALNEKYNIKTVIAVISAGGFYSTKNGTLAQNTLTFAVPGFAQSIVLDSRGESEAQISTINRILWIFNREAKITRSSNSTLSTGQVNDLLTDNLYNSEYHRFLRGKYGSLYRFDSLHQLQVGYISFKYPIFDLPALKLLTQQQGWLVDINSLKEQLKPKRQQAENSKDQLMQGLYKLEEAIAIQRRREKAPHICCLKGTIQNQQGEKIELVWAGQDLREKVISQQNRSLGIFVMAQNYDQFQVKEYLFNLTYKKFLLQGLQTNRREDSLTQEERNLISRQGRNKYLQGGDFYDGYFYRDIQGHILGVHPKLPLLIKEYLEQKNKEIDEQNKKIKQEWQTYRSQYQ